MKRRITLLTAAAAAVIATAVAAVAIGTPASAATLTPVTGFGSNPTNLQMHLYVPDRVASRPGPLLALHYRTGSGPALSYGHGGSNQQWAPR